MSDYNYPIQEMEILLQFFEHISEGKVLEIVKQFLTQVCASIGMMIFKNIGDAVVKTCVNYYVENGFVA